MAMVQTYKGWYALKPDQPIQPSYSEEEQLYDCYNLYVTRGYKIFFYFLLVGLKAVYQRPGILDFF